MKNGHTKVASLLISNHDHCPGLVRENVFDHFHTRTKVMPKRRSPPPPKIQFNEPYYNSPRTLADTARQPIKSPYFAVYAKQTSKTKLEAKTAELDRLNAKLLHELELERGEKKKMCEVLYKRTVYRGE